MKSFILLLVLFITFASYADQPRNRYVFKSKNNRYVLRPSDTLFSDKKVYRDSILNPLSKKYEYSSYTKGDRYYWGVYDSISRNLLYKIKNDSLYIETRTAMISDDGQTVIIIDDYPGGSGFSSIQALHFYNRDNLVRMYSLGELVTNMCNMSRSASHFDWLTGFSAEPDGKLEIKTTEFKTIGFDAVGAITYKTDDPRSIGAEILYGKIKRLGRNHFVLKVFQSINGTTKRGVTINLLHSDREMKKIYREYHMNGLFDSILSDLKRGFWMTFFIVEGNRIRETSSSTYNMPDYCNIYNKNNERND